MKDTDIFQGFPREDGRVGVRNHVLVLSSVACSNGVVNAIGREVPEAKVIVHPEGCGRGPADVGITWRTLSGLGKNPNVAAVLVVGLGCEFITATGLAQDIGSTNKPVEHLVIQEEGGSKKTTAKGVEIAKKLVKHAKSKKPTECGLDQLTLGLECGGSDALSGVTANPLVGRLSEWLVEKGGTTMLSETTEMIGAEHVLARRAATKELGDQIVELVRKQRKQTEEILGDLAHMVISPGNIEGGLTNIIEKSLGCIIKAGTSPLQEIVEYAAPASKKGFVFMDTPGSDVFSLTGMAAGGAQMMIFTTGRGTPVGFPVVPVIKVSSNSDIYEKMGDDIDINAGRLLEGESMDDLERELVDLFISVANGRETRAEENLQDAVSIFTASPPF